MKKRLYKCLILVLGLSGLLSGCGKNSSERTEINSHSKEKRESQTVEQEVAKEENGKESMRR